MTAIAGEPSPSLSVVVALVSGNPRHLRTCLRALHAQRLPDLEILVPYDAPVAAVLDLAPEFPGVRFLLAAGLDTALARTGASREHHDSIRTVGLRAARGRVVALIEDVGRVDPAWSRGLLAALVRHPAAAAVGGGMGCGGSFALQRAVCLSDFWRYQEPMPEMPSEYASDANIAYRKTALEEVRDAWEGDFHETIVNTALRRRGYEVWIAPHATVFQERTGLGWREAFRERYVWGRSFAGTRVRGVALGRRLVFALFCPLLPLVLAGRVARIAWARGSWLRSFALLPLVFALFCVWSLGEAVGYISGSPEGASKPLSR